MSLFLGIPFPVEISISILMAFTGKFLVQISAFFCSFCWAKRRAPTARPLECDLPVSASLGVSWRGVHLPQTLESTFSFRKDLPPSLRHRDKGLITVVQWETVLDSHWNPSQLLSMMPIMGRSCRYNWPPDSHCRQSRRCHITQGCGQETPALCCYETPAQSLVRPSPPPRVGHGDGKNWDTGVFPGSYSLYTSMNLNLPSGLHTADSLCLCPVWACSPALSHHKVSSGRRVCPAPSHWVPWTFSCLFTFLLQGP